MGSFVREFLNAEYSNPWYPNIWIYIQLRWFGPVRLLLLVRNFCSFTFHFDHLSETYFWCRLLLIPMIFHASNIGVLYWRKKIIESEPPPPTITVDKNDFTIMIYWNDVLNRRCIINVTKFSIEIWISSRSGHFVVALILKIIKFRKSRLFICYRLWL